MGLVHSQIVVFEWLSRQLLPKATEGKPKCGYKVQPQLHRLSVTMLMIVIHGVCGVYGAASMHGTISSNQLRMEPQLLTVGC